MDVHRPGPFGEIDLSRLALRSIMAHALKMTRVRMVLVTAMIAVLAALPVRAEEVVDVELVLAVDVSFSMQPDELELQRRGYAEAIASQQVATAIRGGLHQKIALTYVEWAGTGRYRVIVPWTLIDSPEDAMEVSAIIGTTPVSALRRTSISHAIDLSAGMFDNNGFRGLKRVIDISGDGPNNQGRPVVEARNEAVNKGIVINGLPLMTRSVGSYSFYDIPDLDQFYANCVIGGPGAFVLPVTEWSQFPDAVRRKLVLELALAPVPQGLPIVRIAAEEPYNCEVGETMWRQRRYFLDVQ